MEVEGEIVEDDDDDDDVESPERPTVEPESHDDMPDAVVKDAEGYKLFLSTSNATGYMGVNEMTWQVQSASLDGARCSHRHVWHGGQGGGGLCEAHG